MKNDFWQLRTKNLPLRCGVSGTRWMGTLWMGILNVTPDSFSDGGCHQTLSEAVFTANQLIDSGADILDIGAESTRPGHLPVSAEEEIDRLTPLLRYHQETPFSVPISIDTTKAEVVRFASFFPIEIVNCVCDPTHDTALLRAIIKAEVAVCATSVTDFSSLSVVVPKDCHHFIQTVIQDLAGMKSRLTAAGIAENKIALDPGLGFGKTAAQNIAIVEHIRRFHTLDSPILVGHSRKRFLKEWFPTITGNPATNDGLDAATHIVSQKLIRDGVHILRTHHSRSEFHRYDVDK